MVGLKGSVGEGGRNGMDDVAIVQFILALTKEKGVPYYSKAYSGKFDDSTRLAVKAFAGTGRIEPNDKTCKKLLAGLPKNYADLRALAGKDVVLYLGQSRDVANGAKNKISNDTGFIDDFKKKVLALCDEFYKTYGIALNLSAKSDGRRAFGDQLGKKSNAGPGETVHNYGYAVDLGMNGVPIVLGTGSIVVADEWLERASLRPSQQADLWEARNAIAAKHKLYRTKYDEQVHLQNFEDAPLDSVASFMRLMERVGPKKVHWEPRNLTPTDYWCDFGLGGEKYFVGTSLEIWKLEAKVDRGQLAAAATARSKKDATFSLNKFLGMKPDQHEPKEWRSTDISPAHITAVRQMLKGEFDAADKEWRQWKPVLYTPASKRSTRGSVK